MARTVGKLVFLGVFTGAASFVNLDMGENYFHSRIYGLVSAEIRLPGGGERLVYLLLVGYCSAKVLVLLATEGKCLFRDLAAYCADVYELLNILC